MVPAESLSDVVNSVGSPGAVAARQSVHESPPSKETERLMFVPSFQEK